MKKGFTYMAVAQNIIKKVSTWKIIWNCKNGPLENYYLHKYKSMLNDTMAVDEIDSVYCEGIPMWQCYAQVNDLNTVGISPMLWLS